MLTPDISIRPLTDADRDRVKHFIKPQIPLLGNDGIPIRDGIELEMRLGSDQDN